jgi:hypothetical protein
MRSTGHFWGSKAADAAIADGERLTPHAIERRLERIIVERAKALIELGDDDVPALGRRV